MFIAQVGTGAAEEYLREELDLSLPVVPTLQPGNQTRAIRISTALLRITESSSKRFLFYLSSLKDKDCFM